MLAVVLLIAAVAPALADHYWYYKLCLDRIIIVDPQLPIREPIIVSEPPKIIVGCKVIDCCPGCPATGPIDWRIRVIGDPIALVKFKFENISTGNLRELKLKGNAKWTKPGELSVGSGEVLLRGIRKGGDGKPITVSPRLELQEGLMAKVLDADQPPERLGDFELTVEQLIGPVVVNEYKIAYTFRWCYPWWWCYPHFPIFTDKIDLNNNDANDDTVVLMDSRRSSGCKNDEILRGDDVIQVGSVLSPGNCPNEIAVFSDDDAMQLITPTAWTNSLGDTQPVDLTPNRLQSQTNVWLSFAGATPRAQAEIFVTDLLYNQNNTGVGFLTNVNYQDVSNNQNAINSIVTNDVNYCSTAWRNILTTSGFYNANQLNVYYVNQALNGRAYSCIFDRNIVIVGTTAQPESLAHEFGHAFSLGHTTNQAGFGNDNIMWGAGIGRTAFTIGQAFRINVNQTSVLNANGTRTGTTRLCPTDCPALSLDSTPK